MAQDLDFSLKRCLVWKTERPFCDKSRQSPCFSYLDIDFYFRFTLSFNDIVVSSADIYVYCLELHRKDKKELRKDVNIEVFVKYNNSCIAADCTKQLTGKTTTVLQIHNGTQYSTSMYGEWSVYCIFLSEFPVNQGETRCLSKLSDLKFDGDQDCNKPAVFAEAKLAACAPYDCPSGSERLSLDLNHLLEQESFSDVTLNCGDDTFFAHKSILSARSDFFADRFSPHQSAENGTVTIDITGDIDSDIFDRLLKYVYSGKVPDDFSVDNAPSVYEAAHKYAIHSLKNECSMCMLRSLREANCLDYLILADSCRDDVFKERLVSFTAEILHLLNKEVWKKFRDEHSVLAMSVVEKRAFSR